MSIITRNSRKRLYTNMLMFVGLMAMATVAWLDYRDRLPERRPSNDAVDKMLFTGAKGTPFVLEHHGAQWRLTQPFSAPALNSRAARLLEIAEVDFSSGYAVSEINTAASGLDNPSYSIMLGDRQHHFGGIEPLSGKRYLQRDDRVVLLEDRYLPLMLGGVNAFANLELPGTDKRALGLRPATPPPDDAQALSFNGDQWRQWPSGEQWILQRHQASFAYLLSSPYATAD